AKMAGHYIRLVAESRNCLADALFKVGSDIACLVNHAGDSGYRDLRQLSYILNSCHWYLGHFARRRLLPAHLMPGNEDLRHRPDDPGQDKPGRQTRFYLLVILP